MVEVGRVQEMGVAVHDRARPLKIAPGTDSSAVAEVPGGSVNGQAVIIPASESKMNVAGRFWLPT